jgi:SAM-dependent methyltransferase
LSEPAADGLYDDPRLAQLYDLDNPWSSDFDYCLTLARDAESVLDLGCGTGQLTTALSNGRTVAGVDPAAAMLEIARARPGGENVTWIDGDARSMRLGRRFDLVLLTGHAFQFFLTHEDQIAAVSTIAAHLSPKGRFIFDSRNPAIRTWQNRDRNANVRRLGHPQLGEIEAWSEPSYNDTTGILTSTNNYRIVRTGEVLSAPLRIRFTPQAHLAALLASVGLAVDEWLGDWRGNSYHAESTEIIPLGRLA